MISIGIISIINVRFLNVEAPIEHRSRQLRSAALSHEIKDAERLLDAALKNASKLRKEVQGLETQELQADREAAAGRGRQQPASLAKVKGIKKARQRGERLLMKLERMVADKNERLADLKQQASQLDLGLTIFRRNLTPVDLPAPAITGAQIRAARAMLGLSQQALSQRIGISSNTLRRLERQGAAGRARPELLTRIVETLEKAGVDIIGDGLYVGTGGPGVRLRKHGTRAEHGRKPRSAKSGAEVHTPARAVA